MVARRKRIIIASAAVIGLGCAAALAYVASDQTRWLLVRPYYYGKVALLPSTPGEPKKAYYRWRGGVEWDVTLEYDESDTDAPDPGQKEKTWRTPACTHSIKRLEGHFYLNGIYC